MQQAKGVTIVRNHPSDGESFSKQDSLFSHRVDAEIHAISHHGVNYSGKVLDIARLKSQYEVIDRQMAVYMDKLIADKALSIPAAYFYQDHLLNSVLSELGIITYTVTGIDLPPALLPVLTKLVEEFK